MSIFINPFGSGNTNFKGWFVDETALTTAYPTASDGDYAILGSTDTVWVWDSGTAAWVDTSGGATQYWQRTVTTLSPVNAGDDLDMGTGTVSANNLYATSLTPGSVLFIGMGGILGEDNANFHWDNATNSLGIGTIPETRLHVKVGESGATPSGDIFFEKDNVLTFQFGTPDGANTTFQFLDTSGSRGQVAFINADREFRFFTTDGGQILNMNLASGIRFNDSGADIDFIIETTDGNNSFFLEGGNGNLGLKTSTPRVRLDVIHSAHIVPYTPHVDTVSVFEKAGAYSENAIVQIIGGEDGQASLYLGTDNGPEDFQLMYSRNDNEFNQIVSGVSVIRGGTGSLVLGDASVNFITNIPGNGLFNLFRVDGSLNRVAVGAATADRRLHVEEDTATTNAVTNVFRITSTSTGTPVNGIGVGMEFEVETSVGNNEVGALITAEFRDVSAGSEDCALDFYTMAAGAAADRKFRISSIGELLPTNIHNNGGTASAVQAISSGTYTPNAIPVSNVSVATPGIASWMRIGKVLHVAGHIDITPTASGAITTSFRLTLPITFNVTSTQEITGSLVVGGSGAAGLAIGTVATDDVSFIYYLAGSTILGEGLEYRFQVRLP